MPLNLVLNIAHCLCKMYFNIIVRLPRGIIYSVKYFVRLFFVTISYSCYNSRPSSFVRFNLCAGPKVFSPAYSWPYSCPHPILSHSYFIFCQQFFIHSVKMDFVPPFLCTDLLYLSFVAVYFHFFLFNHVQVPKNLMSHAFCFLFIVDS